MPGDRWRAIIPAWIVTGAASVLLWAGAASAASVSFSVSLTQVQSQDQNGNSTAFDTCTAWPAAGGSVRPTFGEGYPYGAGGDQYTQWAWGAFPSMVRLPAGTTLLDATLTGFLAESAVGGGVAPAGWVHLGAGAGRGTPQENGSTSQHCEAGYGGDGLSIRLPGSGAAVPFRLDAYDLADAYVQHGSGPWWDGGQYDLYLSAYAPGEAVWLGPTSPLSLSMQYAYPPTEISVAVTPSGTGHDTTIRWNANGNGSGTSYLLERETDGGGVWSVLYEGPDTGFNTQNTMSAQACGHVYRYRVAVAGSRAHTAWDLSAPWDEAPCSGALTPASSSALAVSWPQLPPGGAVTLYWCPAANCSQRQSPVGGATGATLTSLQANVEYDVWICGASSGWGCPVYAAWTDAARPTALAQTLTTFPDMRLAWDADGNPAGTRYTVREDGVGAAGGVTASLTVCALTTAQHCDITNMAAGHAYDLYVAAVNGGGQSSGWAGPFVFANAPAPTVQATAADSIAVAWTPVGVAARYEVFWKPVGGSTWAGSGDLGPTRVSYGVAGLVPNTAYDLSLMAWYPESGGGGCGGGGCWLTAAPSPTWTLADEPSGLAWSVSGAGVWNAAITWSGAANPAGTRYEVERQTWNGTGLVRDWTALGATTSARLVTADQVCGYSYVYRVRAVNGAGVSTAASGPSALLENAPCSQALAVDGSSTIGVSWKPSAPPGAAGASYTVILQALAGGPYSEHPVGGATDSYTLGDLTPNVRYTVRLDGNDGWWNSGASAYTNAQPTGAPVVSAITGTGFRLSWSADENPPGTTYEYRWSVAGAWSAPHATTATSALVAGLSCGEDVAATSVWAVGDNGQATASSQGEAFPLVPCQPAVHGADGGLGWSATSGRGWVHLAWRPVAGAAGYTLYVFDGREYESFDLGAATSWDSRQARIYPPDASLYPNVAVGVHDVPILSHNGGGTDLRDDPHNLYCSTGVEYCTVHPTDQYSFTLAAYNASGSSAAFQVPGGPGSYYRPSLPQQTDPTAPVIGTWRIGGGGTYTYGSRVPYLLTADEGASGIGAYALSNDGVAWTKVTPSGCVIGQVSPCAGTLSASGTWALSPGPGTKTVWAKVESAAGVWSAPLAATVYVNVDQTVPTVDVTLDGGAATTSSSTVTVAVSVSDPVATRNSGMTWRARYSTDGGQSWSAWQEEGGALQWSVPWALPAGGSGERTVLVQAENADANLGQGGASIYYEAPELGGVSPPPAGRPCQWIVDGAAVNATCVRSSQVTVPLTPPANAVQMRASLDGVNWGPWGALRDALAVDLGSAPGAKSVWVEFRDGYGRQSVTGPSYYVFDPGAPDVRVSWAGDASATDDSGKALLQVQATDPAGVSGLRVQVNEDGVVLYAGPYANDIPLALQGAGYKVIRVVVTNQAGAGTSVQLGIFVE